MANIIFLIGTRPELIKVAPVINEFKKNHNNNYIIVNTGQHKELLNNHWSIFDIRPDINLNIMTEKSSLSELTAVAISRLNEFLRELSEKPKVIFAQGDTTSVMAASMVAYYNDIHFAHLEAGLRTYDMTQPFPEEFNRRAIALLASYHFAPTLRAQNNLLNEGIQSEKIFMVGNTIVDALESIKNSASFKNVIFNDSKINAAINNSNNIVLITIHRRENQNNNLLEVISAIKFLATEHTDYKFIIPVHKNPSVRDVIINSDLNNLTNVLLTEPLNYLELLKIVSVSKIIFSDSGGIQEEAPSFRVPLLILRDKTERPEAIELGYSKLIGCDKVKIIDSFYNFRPSFEANTINPYGDGKAAQRIYKIITDFLSNING